MIRFKCTSCGVILRVSDDKAGRRGKCPKCGQPLQVPFSERKSSNAGGTKASPSTPSGDLGGTVSGVSRTATSQAADAAPGSSKRRARIMVIAGAAVLTCAFAVGVYFLFLAHKRPSYVWPPGTGYLTKPTHCPSKPHVVEPTTCWAMVIAVGQDGKGLFYALDMEIRDGVTVGWRWPGGELRNVNERSVTVTDYNGDNCVVGPGMTVQVDEYGQFFPVDTTRKASPPNPKE